MAEDHLLRLVVELGGDEFPSPTLPPPQHRCANPITRGPVALRADLFTGIGGRGPKFEACCAAPQQRQPSGLVLVAGNVGRWLGTVIRR